MQGTPYESVALQDVTMAVDAGEAVAILGRTGYGKSTLVQHFNGLLRPTRAACKCSARIPRMPRINLRPLRFRVGLVFQFPETQLFEETVRADIGFGPRMMRLSQEEVEARVEKRQTASV